MSSAGLEVESSAAACWPGLGGGGGCWPGRGGGRVIYSESGPDQALPHCLHTAAVPQQSSENRCERGNLDTVRIQSQGRGPHLSVQQSAVAVSCCWALCLAVSCGVAAAVTTGLAWHTGHWPPINPADVVLSKLVPALTAPCQLMQRGGLVAETGPGSADAGPSCGDDVICLLQIEMCPRIVTQ